MKTQRPLRRLYSILFPEPGDRRDVPRFFGQFGNSRNKFYPGRPLLEKREKWRTSHPRPLLCLNKAKFRRGRKGSDFGTEAVVKVQAVEARRVEIVMDVVGQVGANGVDGEAKPRRPLPGDGF